jgi:AraC-like DNA-binding protein
LEHVEGKGPRAAEADQAIRGLFQAALASLLVIIKELKTSARPIEHLKVSACRKYILNRIYDSSLSVKKLAGQLGCSPDYLSHLFVIETGERLSDFIHQERIAMAERHLQNPALSIKEVARACGFADQGYFARLFKRLAGKTPQEFRKKLPSQP